MKRAPLILLLFLSGYRTVFGQAFSFPAFKGLFASAADLRTPNWKVKDSAIGDLNRDRRTDMAVVLEYSDTVTEYREDSDVITSRPRILLVLLRDSATRAYRVVVQNNTFLLRGGEGGMDSDPFDSISIRHGILEVDYQFIHGWSSYIFRYRAPSLYLIGAREFGYSNSGYEGWDVNFSTGMTKHEWGGPPSKGESPDHTAWKKMKPRPPLRLQDIKFSDSIAVFPDVSI